MKSTSLQQEEHEFYQQFNKFKEQFDEYFPKSATRKSVRPTDVNTYKFVCLPNSPTLNSIELADYQVIRKDNIKKTEPELNLELLNKFIEQLDAKKSHLLLSENPRLKNDIEVIRKIQDHQQDINIELNKISLFLIIAIDKDGIQQGGCLIRHLLHPTEKKDSALPTQKSTLLIEAILFPKDQSNWDKENAEAKRERQENNGNFLRWMLIGERRKSGSLSKTAPLRNLVAYIEDTNKSKVEGIFYEAINPTNWRIKAEQPQKADQLAWLYEAGAKYIKFDYQRPCLPAKFSSVDGIDITQSNYASKYLLLTFPQVLTNDNSLPIITIIRFIIVYGYLLNSNYKNYITDLDKCDRVADNKNDKLHSYVRLNGFYPENARDVEDPIRNNVDSLYNSTNSAYRREIYLYNIPRLEQPRFIYKRASVSFEIAVDEDYFDIQIGKDSDSAAYEKLGIHQYPTLKSHTKYTIFGRIWEIIKEEWGPSSKYIINNVYCPITHSGEIDLFAHRYQSDPPYFTKYFKKQETQVYFPTSFEFTSEGRRETYYRLQESTYMVPMMVCVSYTYFKQSNNRIWHIVLKPSEQEDTDGISEFDIIKLMKFFSGSQESEHEEARQETVRRIRFSEKRKNDKKTKKKLATDQVKRWLALPNQADAYILWERYLQIILRYFLWFFSFRWLAQFTSELLAWPFRLLKKWFHSLRYLEEPPTLTGLNEDEPDNLIDLLKVITGVSYRYKLEEDALVEKQDQAVSLRNVRSGIVQIDTGDVLNDQDSASNVDLLKQQTHEDDIFLSFQKSAYVPDLEVEIKNDIRNKVKDFYQILYDDEVADKMPTEEVVPFSVDEYADYIFKAYCGICLGIFDFDRMGLQEVDDTLLPLPESKTDESFLVMHRGAMGMFGFNDDVLESFWNTLGINAYLLIPSAVLANNDMVARDAENRLSFLLNDLRKSRSTYSISEYINQRNEIDDLINDDVLGNVFQYPTEQELYQVGMARRGIDERIKDARSKLDQLDKLIAAKQEERSNRNQRIIQIFATILTILSLYTPLRDLWVDELGYKYSDAKTMKEQLAADELTEKQKININWHDYTIDDYVQKFNDFLDILARFFTIGKHNHIPFKEWLFPQGALDAAHSQILLIFFILVAYSLIRGLSNPKSIFVQFWRRRKINYRQKYHSNAAYPPNPTKHKKSWQ